METRFVHFVLKICSPMRPACERTALIVHEASEMETGEQRSERTIANRRHSVFRQRPQEHDERTVSKSHSLLFHNSLVLYRFSIYLFCKYTKGIRTQYSLYMCKKCAYFLPLTVFILPEFRFVAHFVNNQITGLFLYFLGSTTSR